MKQCIILGSLLGCIISIGVQAASIQQKTAVLVLGHMRSGTSATSGVLSEMGVDFGDNMRPTNEKNPKGFFENRPIELLNHSILEKGKQLLNKGFVALDWSMSDNKDLVKEKIKEVLIQEFDGNSLLGLKHSYISVLLPVYVEALHELGYDVKCVVVIRNPYAIAQSQNKAWNIKQDICLANTAQIYFALLRDLKSLDFEVILYDDLMNNTQEVIDRLHLLIPGTKSYQEAQEEINEFLEPSLHHNKSK